MLMNVFYIERRMREDEEEERERTETEVIVIQLHVFIHHLTYHVFVKNLKKISFLEAK